MHKLLCLDRYNSKQVTLTTARPIKDFTIGNHLVYELPGGNEKQSLAIYLGTETENTERS